MEILQLLLVSSTTEEWLEKKAGKKEWRFHCRAHSVRLTTTYSDIQ